MAEAISAGAKGGAIVDFEAEPGSRRVPEAWELPTPAYPVNDRGQTYGADIDAPNPAQGPDLVRAYATNGKLGYVYGANLNDEPAFSSPEEAAAWSRATRSESPRSIPVYELDGVTVIGEFKIG